MRLLSARPVPASRGRSLPARVSPSCRFGAAAPPDTPARSGLRHAAGTLAGPPASRRAQLCARMPQKPGLARSWMLGPVPQLNPTSPGILRHRAAFFCARAPARATTACADRASAAAHYVRSFASEASHSPHPPPSSPPAAMPGRWQRRGFLRVALHGSTSCCANPRQPRRCLRLRASADAANPQPRPWLVLHTSPGQPAVAQRAPASLPPTSPRTRKPTSPTSTAPTRPGSTPPSPRQPRYIAAVTPAPAPRRHPKTHVGPVSHHGHPLETDHPRPITSTQPPNPGSK